VSEGVAGLSVTAPGFIAAIAGPVLALAPAPPLPTDLNA